MRFALYSVTYKIGFPGWPEPILDSVTGFGASIEKEGACTSPLFHFYWRLRRACEKAARHPPPDRWLVTRSNFRLQTNRHPSLILTPINQLGVVNQEPKKVSGRWGHRPLGRGGWRVP